MSKYGIFLKNSQNTACQTELWFHFNNHQVVRRLRKQRARGGDAAKKTTAENKTPKGRSSSSSEGLSGPEFRESVATSFLREEDATPGADVHLRWDSRAN